MIDLQPFCDIEDCSRPYLASPFSDKNWTYATNGVIAVRVPRREGCAGHPDAPPAKVEAVMRAHCEQRVALTTLNVPPPRIADCEDCDDGKAVHECPACTCACETCNGTRKYEAAMFVRLRGAPFNAKYLRLLATLPDLRFALEPKAAQGAYFTFDGGDGCLMALTENNDVLDVECCAEPSAAA